MKHTKAKEALRRRRALDLIIENKTDELTRTRLASEGRTGRRRIAVSEERRAYFEKETQRITGKIGELIRERSATDRLLERLPPEDYALLYRLYVRGETLACAAAELGRSLTWATTTHSRALGRFEESMTHTASKSADE